MGSSGSLLRCLGCVLLVVSCQRPKPPTKSDCPPETRPEPARANQIIKLLTAASAETVEAEMCFGELWPSRVITNGPFLLDESASNEELAARVGHLLQHKKNAALFDSPPANKNECEAWVAELLVAEAGAYGIELRLRRALGVATRPYAFEEEVWRVEEAQREAIILRYLQEHPSGGGGVDGLGAGYLRRCLGKNEAQAGE